MKFVWLIYSGSRRISNSVAMDTGGPLNPQAFLTRNGATKPVSAWRTRLSGFRHRNECILKLLESFPPGGAFFDIGGGNGFVAKAIQDAGIDVVLIEPGPAGVRNAQAWSPASALRHVKSKRAFSKAVSLQRGYSTHYRAPSATATAEFLLTIGRRLQPSGRVYLTTPAFGWLWSNEDVRAGHYRRYAERGLRALCESAGFQVECITTFFNFSYRCRFWRFGRYPTGSESVTKHYPDMTPKKCAATMI